MRRSVLALFGVWGEPARDAVYRALEAVPGVDEVHVDVYSAQAVVVHHPRCSAAHLTAAIELAGRGSFYARPSPSRRPRPRRPV